MIIGTDLSDWLACREAQRASRRLTDALGRDWADSETVGRIARTMTSLECRTAEAVAQAVCGLFADRQLIDGAVGCFAATLAADPFCELPLPYLNSELHRGLILYEDELVSIAVGVTDIAELAAKKSRPRGGGSIAFSGQVEVLRFVQAGGARLSFWNAPAIGADFRAAEAGRCARVDERRIADGEILVVDGRCESFIIDHAAANLLILQASAKPDRAPLSVEYDAATGAYLRCSAADDSASRIQMIATLLRALDCADGFAAIADFLDHPSFFVRWHVMRELLGLDVGAALPHLKRMAARDPHPEARGAARAVLDRIEKPRPGQRRAA